MNTKYDIQGFKVHAKFIEPVYGFPFDSQDKMWHNRFIITMQKDKIRRAFSWYDSYSNWQKGIKEVSQDDLKDAIRNYLSDALSGSGSFDDFANEYGYDTDSIKAYKVYRACKRSYAKLQAFGLSDNDISDLVNKLDDSEA